LSLHQKPTKSLAQVASEHTPNEGCDLVESPVAPLPALLLYYTDATSVGVSRQDNTE
jgi:hypothetical protein